MQDTGRKESETKQGVKDRQSEATSKETLSDLRESEKVSDSSRHDSSSLPSPDGQPARRGEESADGADTGDPM